MGARQKLNGQYVTGAIGIASVIGLWAESWGAFAVTAMIFLAMGVYSGEIR